MAPSDPSNDWDDVVYNLGRTDPAWTPTEVHPRIWQGGTPDDDLVVAPGTLTSPWSPSVSVADFDSCLTLTPVAGPAGTGVVEYRLPFPDSDAAAMHLASDVEQAARWAAGRWEQGDRVLVRCRAGLNRSGLLAALTICMVAPDLAWEDVVAGMRQARHGLVLVNESFYALGRELASQARR